MLNKHIIIAEKRLKSLPLDNDYCLANAPKMSS